MSHLPLRPGRFTVFLRLESDLTLIRLATAFLLVFFLNTLVAQRVGINTDTPVAGLDILSNDGLLIQGEFGNGNLPFTGYGTRMLFNPKTGAFRTGRITDEENGAFEEWWNFFNVGDYSFAAGINTKAKGYGSSAFGHKTQANGLGSFAAGGRTNNANADMAFMSGFENTAQSYAEFVIGQKAESYTPLGLTYFDVNDRLFVVGNGVNVPHNAMTILKNGNVGINISSPQYLLDVSGTARLNKAIINDSLKTNTLRISYGAADGYLLLSDANGNASWTSSSTLFSDDWTANGNNVFNNNSGNVGVGVNNPQDKLHVSGNMRIEQGRINFTNTGFGTFVGNQAGLSDFTTLQNANTFVGESAGTSTNTGSENAVVGAFALQFNTSGDQNTAIGHSAMSNNVSGNYNTAIGYHALGDNTVGAANVALGYYALNHTNNGGNVGIGDSAGNNNVSGTGNVFIGQSAGHDVLGTNNVMLGHEAGYFETGSDKLYIENSTSTNPLIYGDFSKNKVVINDSLQSKYLRMTNGAGIGYLLQSDANGNATWSTPSSIFSDDWSANGSDVYNTNVGNIGIGTNDPQDKLHVSGNLRIDQGRIHFANTGESILIGDAAGLNDDYSTNRNIFIGQGAGEYTTNGANNVAIGRNALNLNVNGNGNLAIGEFSMLANTSGNLNVAIGPHALESNTTGESNTALGFFAGASIAGNENTILGREAGFNTLGSGNIMLGFQAGSNETGSHKLYIDNSNTSTPLIYGDFDADHITINDSLTTKMLRVNGQRISFLNTGHSVFIGEDAGKNDDHSDNNSVFIGHQAGKSNTEGTNNIAIGAFALDEAGSSNYNIAMGENVLGDPNLSANYNTGIGNFSLASVTSGGDNIAMGQNAGGSINDGTRNVAIGNYSLDANTDGGYNTVVGYEALGANVHGNNNTIMGHFAANNVTGSNNVMIGYNAGMSTTGSGNVMLGMEAGSNETGSDKLYIDNTGSSTPLIHGDFTSNEVTINDSLTVNKELSVGTSVANSTLEVNGSVAAKFKTPLVAGTTNPDDSGMVWRYNSGNGNIVLPAASSCPNRMYVIINQTGTPRSISSYRDLTTTPSTTINSSVALWIMSDGLEWWQIK